MPATFPDAPSSEEELRELIEDEVEENLQLDYKAAGALQATDDKKREVTIDVSAMANAAGGQIIYGIREDAERRHLAGELDPIDRREFSKERLEHVIANIRPRIEELEIIPLPLSSGEFDVAYVVNIPKSTTAHQAQDQRYYKRFNFESVPMDDHEVRDVMGRADDPKIKVRFKFNQEVIEKSQLPGPMATTGSSNREKAYYLEVSAYNSGSVVANHVVVALQLPAEILHEKELAEGEETEREVTRWLKNTYRDVVDAEVTVSGAIPKYGPSRYDPMLPNLGRRLERLRLSTGFPGLLTPPPGPEISWTAHADEAAPREGSCRLTMERFTSDLGLE